MGNRSLIFLHHHIINGSGSWIYNKQLTALISIAVTKLIAISETVNRTRFEGDNRPMLQHW
jgi:hypothetical protein